MISWKELLFQLLLHTVVFIFYSFDRTQSTIQPYHFGFFLNYTLAAALINYYLLPRFFYLKKYLIFSISVIMLIGVVMLVEELLLEPLFFPNTRRAQTFPGLFFTLWGVLPVIAILSGFKFAWDAIGKQREVEALQATVKESQLQFLKSQINPHFLFNNLNNLYSYAITQSPKTPKIILELSAVLRYMLYECREQFVPLPKEIDQLRNFTQLYQLQIEERGIVNFTATGTDASYRIAPLILIVFIENAFKHSQAGQSENIRIDISIKMEGDTLHFHCKNNYKTVAIPKGKEQGIGLDNVKKRLQLLYPDAHELRIDEAEDKYEVWLSLQLGKTEAP